MLQGKCACFINCSSMIFHLSQVHPLKVPFPFLPCDTQLGSAICMDSGRCSPVFLMSQWRTCSQPSSSFIITVCYLQTSGRLSYQNDLFLLKNHFKNIPAILAKLPQIRGILRNNSVMTGDKSMIDKHTELPHLHVLESHKNPEATHCREITLLIFKG